MLLPSSLDSDVDPSCDIASGDILDTDSDRSSLPDNMSHSVRSILCVTITDRPSDEKLISSGSFTWKVRRILPSARSQTLTVWSQLPDNTLVPSKENASDLMASEWPTN